MRLSLLFRLKRRIIGLLLVAPLLLLGGCSSIYLAYNNGALLAWWWIDGYADFNREQTPLVKQNIDKLLDWHRATQLPLYLPLLGVAQAQVAEPTTPALACRWQDQARALLEPTLERSLELAAEVVPTMGEAQFKHMEGRYAKVIAEMREEFLQPDPAERLAESQKRAVKRGEMLYGRLDAAQRAVILAGVKVSPFNPELWMAERQRRQRDTVQTLRRLVTEKADREQRIAALRTLAARVERSPDPEYRAYQIKLNEYNCGLVAQWHNATTPAQRKVARDKLKAWENDLRALVARE